MNIFRGWRKLVTTTYLKNYNNLYHKTYVKVEDAGSAITLLRAENQDLKLKIAKLESTISMTNDTSIKKRKCTTVKNLKSEKYINII